jgi:hypothetical protein
MYFVVVNLGYPGGAVYAADHPEIGPLPRCVLGQSNLRFGRRRPLSALKCALRRHRGLRRRPMNRAFFRQQEPRFRSGRRAECQSSELILSVRLTG